MKRIYLILIPIIIFANNHKISAEGDGYGVNNGGNSGDTVTVTNATDFRKYVTSSTPYIVKVSGTIDLGGNVNISGNKTITGVDTLSSIKGCISLDRIKNVIIKNLNISNLNISSDGISLYYTTNVLITHCTVFDCTDGSIDITRESDFVTVSYCKFYYKEVENHKFPNLIGAGDNDTTDRGKLHVTFHHN